tara:strand:- start:11 stop:1249 length:1239 start_codon:yes stop_codon:yes gene_type:complete
MAAPKVDILVNLLTALQPFASNVTTLPLNDADQPSDYSRLIGGMVVDHDTRLSQLTSSLNTLYGYTTILQNQMATIIANGLVVPQIQLYVIMGDYAYYNVEVVVAAIGSQLDTLRIATGTSTTLGQAVLYQDKVYENISQTLAAQTSLSSSPTIMSGLTGWVASPATAADSIKNMWITINDMRKAVQTRFTPSVYANCTAAGIVIDFNTYMDIPNNRITLFFLGNCTIPDGFIDTDANGASLRITDASSTPNVYTTYVNVSQANKSVSGITIDLTGTGINLYTNLTLLLTYSLTNGSLVCGSTRTNSVTSAGSPCVALTLTPLSTTAFTGVFTPAVVGSSRIVTYSITTFSNADCSTSISGSTVSYVNPTQNSLSYNVTSGLSTATTYYVRMTVAIGGNTATNCTVQTIKTL